MLPVVVLAGGLATRLRPATEKIPKSLIDINGEPFIIHQLRLFQMKGVKRVHFCLGYLGYLVEETVKTFDWTMEITFSYDGVKLLGTGGAIVNGFNYLPDTFFVTYGDSYLDIDYQDVAKIFEEYPNRTDHGLMTVFENNEKWDTSNVIFENNQITLYSKKFKDPKIKYIDFGLGILNKIHFQNFQPEMAFDLSEIYESLSKENKLLGYESANRFYEIGSFSGIQDLSYHLTKYIE